MEGLAWKPVPKPSDHFFEARAIGAAHFLRDTNAGISGGNDHDRSSLGFARFAAVFLFFTSWRPY
jgi:hypothetical protein